MAIRRVLWRNPRHVTTITRPGPPQKQFAASARWLSTEVESGHKWSTPLAQQLAQAIKTTGPIPVASFMRQCLTSDLGGYYTAANPQDRDQFGVKGDFVTSPEISQIFGELIGIWIVAEWIAQGRKSEGVYLMEVGPGRGTLMDDILRTIRNFPDFARAIEAVYMVEASTSLRRAQHKLLCGEHPLTENDELHGHESTSQRLDNVKVIWCEDVRFVPRKPHHTPFIIAHEFFDALPIHVFQVVPPAPPEASDQTIQTPTGPIPAPKKPASLSPQWREMMVSPRAPHKLRIGEPEFELTLSRAATPHSMYLPETSPRYQAVKAVDGATIEISPESQAYVRDFAIRLGGSNPASSPDRASDTNSGKKVPSVRNDDSFSKPEASGAALIIDYGTASTIPTNSLRGIRAHARVSPFEAAGTTDVSADVDFLGLAEAALNGSPNVEVHGPVDQGRFLTAMGIQERAMQLVKRAIEQDRGGGANGADKTELTETVKRIETGWKRLIDQSPQGMGRLYQVMAIVPYWPASSGKARRRPVGFGGDISL